MRESKGEVVVIPKMYRGWQAVAEFLQVSVEEAKALQRRGLPIARIKGRIMTSNVHLLAWLGQLQEDEAQANLDGQGQEAVLDALIAAIEAVVGPLSVEIDHGPPMTFRVARA